MTQKQRERQIGILEIACALAALATVSASLVWEVNGNLFIVLIMLVAAYAVLLRVLWLSKKTRNEGSDTSEASVPVHQRTPGETRPRAISLLRE